MLIDLSWDNEEKTILRYSYKKGWGYSDVSAAMKIAGGMVAEQEHNVDILMDFRDASILPQGALGYTHRYFKNPKPDNLGITVILAKQMFLKVIYDAAQKVWGNKEQPWKLVFVSDESEAYEVIAKLNEQHPVEKKA